MKDDDGAKYPMVAVDDALAIVLEHTAPLPTETVPLLTNGTAPALRRCLADSVKAAAPFPQFRAAISDGYCCAANGQEQTLHDDGSKQLAGTSATLLSEGACRYITTGAPLPEGADAVAKQEHCARNGAEVSLPPLKPGADVREVGSDWALGDELCSKATPLTPSDIAILAAAGHEQNKLKKRVRLAKKMIKELEAPAPKITASQKRWGKIRAHVTKRRPQQGSLLPDKEKILRLKRVVWRAKLGKMGRGNALRRVKLFLRIHRRKLSIWAANIVWLGVGVVYAIAKERWSLTRGIYFAVSSLSTAGLQGIPLASKDWQYAFVGFWCLVGVPLFAAGVGELAGLFVREDCEVEARAQDWGSYGESDWHAAVGALRRHIDLTGDSLTREQFLLSQLLLSGAASHDVVDIIYDRYRTINTDNDDAITREEFLHHVEKSSPPKAPTPAHVKLARSLSARITSK